MAIMVNGEKIDDVLIEEEVERMRPQYQTVFKDQSPQEQEKQLREWARENVIERILIQQQARKDPKPISAKKIDEALKRMVQEYGGEDQFYESTGLPKSDTTKIKKDIELQLRVERLLEEICANMSQPTEMQILKYYKDNSENYMSPERVHAAHIVKHIDVHTSAKKAKQAILKIQREIKSGKKFEEVASRMSDCPGNEVDLGYFSPGQMVQSFDDVVFSMNKNEISDVFRTEFGYHIAKVYDTKPKTPIPIDQVKEGIAKQLYEDSRNTTIESFIDELKAKSEITEILSSESISLAEQDVHQIGEVEQPKKTRVKPIKSLNSVLVKPAGPDCNLACQYCFYLEKSELFPHSKKHRMSLEVLEEMIRQVMQYGAPSVSFGWQGGEPTLMGLEFFQKAVEFQQKYGRDKTVGNGLQTNGIMIDKEWAGFLTKYNFLIGLSLDGPQHVHDHYRVNLGGKGSWNTVVDHGKLLLDSGASVNALTVVNDYSVQFPEEIYNFHKGLGLTFQQYIPCVETDPMDRTKAASFSVSAEQYGEFLCRVFDLWINDFKNGEPTTSIRHFDSVFHTYVGVTPPECTLLKECGTYVVIEHNGEVYSCDFFVNPEWKLGHIMEGNLYDFLNSDHQYAFGQMKASLPQPCLDCQWLPYCWGGCTKDRIRDPQDQNLSHFCQSYKMFFDHAHGRLTDLAQKWQQDQMRNAKRDKVIESLKSGKIKVGRNDPCPCGSGKKFKKCCGADL